MADPFIGEVRIFAGTFAPRDWAFCNGQTIQVSQNPALFSLLSSIYGGDGRTDFGVPNLPGRAPMGAGNGPGLTQRSLGQIGGVETVTLTQANMPSHDHVLEGTAEDDNEASPIGNYMGAGNTRFAPASNLEAMSASALSSVGGNAAHTNQQPYLAIHFIIALTGTFPSRN